jgi:hypothetical protein
VMHLSQFTMNPSEDHYKAALSGFHQVALWLGPNGLRPQGLKEYSDDYLALDNLRPIMESKCLVMQTTGNYLGLGPLEETLERMFQVATWTFNLLYYFPYSLVSLLWLVYIVKPLYYLVQF